MDERTPTEHLSFLRRLMGDAKGQTKWLKALFDMSLGVRYTSLLVTKGFTDIDQYAREADKLHDMLILQDLRDKKKERAEATNINVIDSHTEMLKINGANLERKVQDEANNAQIITQVSKQMEEFKREMRDLFAEQTKSVKEQTQQSTNYQGNKNKKYNRGGKHGGNNNNDNNRNYDNNLNGINHHDNNFHNGYNNTNNDQSQPSSSNHGAYNKQQNDKYPRDNYNNNSNNNHTRGNNNDRGSYHNKGNRENTNSDNQPNNQKNENNYQNNNYARKLQYTQNLNDDNICWFHEKFLSKAKKCVDGCKYIANKRLINTVQEN